MTRTMWRRVRIAYNRSRRVEMLVRRQKLREVLARKPARANRVRDLWSYPVRFDQASWKLSDPMSRAGLRWRWS